MIAIKKPVIFMLDLVGRVFQPLFLYYLNSEKDVS